MKDIVSTLVMSGGALMVVVLAMMTIEDLKRTGKPTAKIVTWVTRVFNVGALLMASAVVLTGIDLLLQFFR